MKKFFTQPKNIFLIMLFLLLMSYLPIILAGIYNHPSVDDFSYSSSTAIIWRSTKSIPSVFSAAVQTTQQTYREWQGSFSGVFLMALQPAIFSESLYVLVTPILLLCFSLSLFYTTVIVLTKYFQADFYKSGIVAIALIFLTVQFVYSPVEAFFWYNGSMYYTLFFAVTVFLLGFLLSTMKEQKMSFKIIRGVISCGIGFFIGGGNFVVALVATLLLFVLAVRFLASKDKNALLPLAAGIATSIALLISVTAPGNAMRQQIFQGMSPFVAIISSFYYALLFFILYIRITVIFGVLALMPFIYRISRASNLSFPLPGIASLVIFGLYASSFTPNLYGMGGFGPARVANINQYFAILALVCIITYWCGWIAHKQNPYKSKKTKTDNSFFAQGTLTLAGCFVLGFLFIGFVKPSPILSIAAMQDITNGTASAYNAEYQQRLLVLSNHEEQKVSLPAFQNKPYVLFFDDITTDFTDWRNVAYAKYYEKETVVLQDS